MDAHGRYRNANILVNTGHTGYIGVHHDPPASTDSQAIRWGKSGVKIQAAELCKG